MREEDFARESVGCSTVSEDHTGVYASPRLASASVRAGFVPGLYFTNFTICRRRGDLEDVIFFFDEKARARSTNADTLADDKAFAADADSKRNC